MIKIGIFVGSLRKDSYSRCIALAVDAFLPSAFHIVYPDMSKLSLFNQDYDDLGATPPAWTAFRDEVKTLDAFLFVTPEYNRSIPPVLKNALDIASRPYGENCWDGKPGAVIGVSPGRLGGFGSCHHLRQVTSFLNIYMMQQPEVYISNVEDILDDNGNISDKRSAKFLQSVADAYAQWVSRFT